MIKIKCWIIIIKLLYTSIINTCMYSCKKDISQKKKTDIYTNEEIMLTHSYVITQSSGKTHTQLMKQNQRSKYIHQYLNIVAICQGALYLESRLMDEEESSIELVIDFLLILSGSTIEATSISR